MKSFTNYLSTFIFGILLVGLTANGFAQDIASTTKTYNEARELAQQGNFDEAIVKYEQALANAETLGEEGQDIVERVERALPSVYFEKAKQVYAANRESPSPEAFDEIIAAFQEAQDVAEQFESEQRAAQAGQIITQMYYNKSLYQFNNENFDGSLASLNTAIERNANYAKAYYQKALVLKRQEGISLEELIAAYDKAIAVAEQTNDNETVRRANDNLAEELVYRGAKQIENNRYDEAIELLNRALNYNSTDADAYYRLAEAYNKKAEWGEALPHAQQALEHETGGRTDQAKIYFEIGLAQQGLGNKTEACQALANAAYGSFKQPAEHKMEHELECEGS